MKKMLDELVERGKQYPGEKWEEARLKLALAAMRLQKAMDALTASKSIETLKMLNGAVAFAQRTLFEFPERKQPNVVLLRSVSAEEASSDVSSSEGEG